MFLCAANTTLARDATNHRHAAGSCKGGAASIDIPATEIVGRMMCGKVASLLPTKEPPSISLNTTRTAIVL